MVAQPDSVAREEEERANMWGPHVGDRGERCGAAQRCKLMRETYSYGVLRVHEPARLAGRGGGLGGVVGWGE
jgi:hypothetical protein